jgi:pre-60S factor REI1
LGYCHEKIKLGHYCLYCEQIFPTWSGCQKHMVDKQHTKLRYEKDYWEELDPFYDFKAEDAAFLGEATGVAANVKDDEVLSDSDDEEDDDVVMEEDGDDEDWEDIGSDDEAVYSRYEKAMEAFGLDITPLGELVFPDGRIVGHRALRKYYKQRFRAENTSTAMVAAKTAAGERMYDGRVVQIGQPSEQSIRGAGKGVLVALKGAGAAGFTALSLYRYRAIVKKQRRDDNKGRILKNRTALPINKMDKKANRMMNGVSVAHAAR